MIVSDLTQVVFTVPTALSDVVATFLLENVGVGGGLEQRDAQTLSTVQNGNSELVVWLSQTDVERCVAQVGRFLDELKEMGTLTEAWAWRAEPSHVEDWKDAYKRYFPINRVGRRFVIKPSWEDYKPGFDDIMIQLDPGQAFGTGLHASTQLVLKCLERLARLSHTPQSVLDLGCGTGILAIGAAKLWRGARVWAIDNDPVAVAVCRENVATNGLTERIIVEENAASGVKGRYGLILANLSFEVLDGLEEYFLNHLQDETGRLVLSGLLADQAKIVSANYCKRLMFEVEYSEEVEGWRVTILKLGQRR